MTLLTIVQTVADEVGVPRPSSVIGSNDLTVRQLLALANREGKLLARRGNWTALVNEHTFTTVAQEEQTDTPIPADFDRAIGDTVWNRTDQDPGMGPLSPQEWQQEKASSASGPYSQFRIRNGKFLLFPAPDAGKTYAYEYVSRNWCRSSGGTGQSAWAADDDVGILDESLMEMGLKWRFRAAKGLDYSEEFRDYEAEVIRALSRDTWSPSIDMAAEGLWTGIRPPDGSWPLT